MKLYGWTIPTSFLHLLRIAIFSSVQKKMVGSGFECTIHMRLPAIILHRDGMIFQDDGEMVDYYILLIICREPSQV